MNTKKCMVGIVSLMALTALTACGNKTQTSKSSLEQVKSAKVLKVAVSPDYPPFEFQMLKNGKNQVVGSDIDLAKAIAKKLGVKVQIEPMDFNNVLASLSTGKADIAISGISKTPERAKSVAFSDIYYEADNALVVKKSELERYTNAADFKGKKVAAQKGAIQEEIVQKQLKGASEIALPAITDEINEVKAGQVQGAVIEGLIAKSYVAANPDLAIAKLKLKTPTDSYGSAVALPKGETELTKVINEVIKSQKANGQIEQSIQSNYKLSQSANK